ncbi:hypothetical protein P9314_14135, partial [Paenibacillus validus]|nr:hypothetical protein [Paenibacillus validus]MED4606835.1 hypothetical protein [Paenibacillus validus]
NQQGHDAYLRSDSTQPAQSQYGIGAASGINNSAYTSTSFGSNAFQANQPNNQYQSAQSFHTAGYRGDQPGHDAYLRSDSTQTAQSQYGIGASSYANSPYTSSFSTGINSNQQQMGTGASYSQFQNQSPQSYHTASYRGNQQGHDAYLRSDSTQPAQSQYGMGASGMNRYQF